MRNSNRALPDSGVVVAPPERKTLQRSETKKTRATPSDEFSEKSIVVYLCFSLCNTLEKSKGLTSCEVYMTKVLFITGVLIVKKFFLKVL